MIFSKIGPENSLKLFKKSVWLRPDGMKLFLGSNWKQTIEKLTIVVNTSYNQMKPLTSVLKSLELKPKVQKLLIYDVGLYGAFDILQYLNPMEIRDLTIYLIDGEWQDRLDAATVKVVHENVFELAQWKNLKSFAYQGSLYCDDIPKHFSHFNYAHFYVDTVPTCAQVMLLKENLLKNENLDEIQIKVDLNEDIRNEFRSRLTPTSAFETSNLYKAKHTPPAPGKKTLSVYFGTRLIWFKGPMYVEKEKIYRTYGEREDIEDQRWMHFFY